MIREIGPGGDLPAVRGRRWAGTSSRSMTCARSSRPRSRNCADPIVAVSAPHAARGNPEGPARAKRRSAKKTSPAQFAPRRSARNRSSPPPAAVAPRSPDDRAISSAATTGQRLRPATPTPVADNAQACCACAERPRQPASRQRRHRRPRHLAATAPAPPATTTCPQ